VPKRLKSLNRISTKKPII
jgi:hypothetical protein